MGDRDTPPCSGPNTQTPQTPLPEVAGTIASPRSIVTTSPDQAAPSSTVPIPKNPTQTLVEADPQLKRLQQDLLVLSSLNENSTLHWRPSWFAQEPFSKQFWTLQNPPNVVTEKLPSTVPQGREYYTRRMRREDDAPPYYIKSWEHWERYCEMYGIPQDFLCKEQVELIRVGLPRDKKGMLCPPPTHPLYPEPQPLGQGRYILDPSTYTTHLAPNFHSVNHDTRVLEDLEAVIVHSNGVLKVESREYMYVHNSQFTHFDGTGKYCLDAVHSYDERAPKQQGPGRRWSYVPWTREQGESYAVAKATLVVKLKVKVKRNMGGVRDLDAERGGKVEEKGKKKKKKRNTGRV